MVERDPDSNVAGDVTLPDENRSQGTELAEHPQRGLGKRAAGRERTVYVAAALALTEPGPAAGGLVVTDGQGRILAHRSQYFGRATRREASAQALLWAMRLAVASGLEAPVFRIDDATLAEAIGGKTPLADPTERLIPVIQEQLAQIPGHRIEVIPSSANLARSVALAPLVEWLPERTQRAQPLQVRPLGDGVFEVESERIPGQKYRVTLRAPGDPGEGDPVQCECADFLYRTIPCKHLLAVARETGGVERLFHASP
jgi:hypothetical protein